MGIDNGNCHKIFRIFLWDKMAELEAPNFQGATNSANYPCNYFEVAHLPQPQLQRQTRQSDRLTDNTSVLAIPHFVVHVSHICASRGIKM